VSAGGAPRVGATRLGVWTRPPALYSPLEGVRRAVSEAGLFHFVPMFRAMPVLISNMDPTCPGLRAHERAKTALDKLGVSSTRFSVFPAPVHVHRVHARRGSQYLPSFRLLRRLSRAS